MNVGRYLSGQWLVCFFLTPLPCFAQDATVKPTSAVLDPAATVGLQGGLIVQLGWSRHLVGSEAESQRTLS